jgi:hypothetical protein
MSVFTRIRRAIHTLTEDEPRVPNTADMQDETENGSGWDCRWFEASFKYRSPLNDGDNLPGGCDTHCPARLQMEYKAEMRERENSGRMFF